MVLFTKRTKQPSEEHGTDRSRDVDSSLHAEYKIT